MCLLTAQPSVGDEVAPSCLGVALFTQRAVTLHLIPRRRKSIVFSWVDGLLWIQPVKTALKQEQRGGK